MANYKAFVVRNSLYFCVNIGEITFVLDLQKRKYENSLIVVSNMYT
jgi:hypothetical protein